jgi:hypothetical protein
MPIAASAINAINGIRDRVMPFALKNLMADSLTRSKMLRPRAVHNSYDLPDWAGESQPILGQRIFERHTY